MRARIPNSKVLILNFSNTLGRHRLSAADAGQLASCLLVRREVSDAVPLVTFDERLTTAGRDEGIRVLP